MSPLRHVAGACFAGSLAFAAAALAEPVTMPHRGLTANADLATASPGGLADGVVLIVHGTLAHHRMEIVETLQSLLAERGVNSLAITLTLGVSAREGMFDCAATHTHLHTDALDEIAAWRDWLDARGAGPVVLLGHSRGGNQAARYALANPARLAGLVLVAPGTDDGERIGAGFPPSGPGSLDAARARARTAAPDDVLDDVQFLHCGQSRVSARSFLSYYGDDPDRDTPSLLPRVPIPVLVVAGSADTVVPDAAERTRPHVDADTRLVVVDGADHFFRDLYAEDAADAVAAFVEEVSK